MPYKTIYIYAQKLLYGCWRRINSTLVFLFGVMTDDWSSRQSNRRVEQRVIAVNSGQDFFSVSSERSLDDKIDFEQHINGRIMLLMMNIAKRCDEGIIIFACVSLLVQKNKDELWKWNWEKSFWEMLTGLCFFNYLLSASSFFYFFAYILLFTHLLLSRLKKTPFDSRNSNRLI